MSQKMISNKKAYRDYFILQKWECGIALIGAEVKSIRDGKVNFKDSYARIDNGEVFVHNLHINPYEQASYMNEEPDRKRKLLLHKREIHKISIEIMTKKLALIPTKIYFNNRGYAKIELALAKGKKRFDKRETIKKRVIDRQLGRIIRNKQR